MTVVVAGGIMTTGGIMTVPPAPPGEVTVGVGVVTGGVVAPPPPPPPPPPDVGGVTVEVGVVNVTNTGSEATKSSSRVKTVYE